MEEVRKVIGETAPAVVRSVLDRWNRILIDEPWWSTSQVDSDHLVELVRHTADAALGDPNEETVAEFVATAMEHGRDRRGDGHKDTVVHQEFVLLRRALRAELLERCEASPATHAAIARLNGALNHAEIASLYGYHEPELPADSAAKAPARLTRDWLDIREAWPA
jgi:hypothetical protein